MAKRFISIEDAARILNTTVEDVEKLIAAKKLDPFRDGDKTFCKTDEVLAIEKKFREVEESEIDVLKRDLIWQLSFEEMDWNIFFDRVDELKQAVAKEKNG